MREAMLISTEKVLCLVHNIMNAESTYHRDIYVPKYLLGITLTRVMASKGGRALGYNISPTSATVDGWRSLKCSEEIAKTNLASCNQARMELEVI